MVGVEGREMVSVPGGSVVPATGRGGRALMPILVFALFIRLLLLSAALVYTRDPMILYGGDTTAYLIPARSMIDASRFWAGTGPEVGRTPGYPVFMLPGLLIGHFEAVTIALQLVASLVTVALVYRIAMLLFERRSLALLCAFLYAIEPLSVLYATKLMSETLFTALVTAFLYFLLRYLKRSAPGDLVAAAVALVASVYVRPIAYFLPLILAIGLGVRAVRAGRGQRGRLIGHIVLFLVVSMGLTGLWQVRNRAVADYGGFTSTSEHNLYFYPAASVKAAEKGIPYYEIQKEMGHNDDALYFRLHPEQRTWTQGERFRWMGRQGREILLSAPMTYARIHLDGMARTLLDPVGTDYLKVFKIYPMTGGLLGKLVDRGLWEGLVTLYRDLPTVFWANVVLLPLHAFFLLFSAVALCSRRVLRDPAALAMVGIAAYFLVIAGGPVAYGRFRHPDMPIVCVLAGCGLFRLIDRWARCWPDPLPSSTSDEAHEDHRYATASRAPAAVPVPADRRAAEDLRLASGPGLEACHPEGLVGQPEGRADREHR